MEPVGPDPPEPDRQWTELEHDLHREPSLHRDRLDLAMLIGSDLAAAIRGAAAQGMPAERIRHVTGVTASVIERLISGQQDVTGEDASASGVRAHEVSAANPAVQRADGPGFDESGWPTLVNLAAAIARASVPMVLDRPAWVHRRVESIVFLGDNRMLRRISVDFTIPNFPSVVVTPDGVQRLAYVPLTLLDKRVLENFDLRDEAGRALSSLGQTQHNLCFIRTCPTSPRMIPPSSRGTRTAIWVGRVARSRGSRSAWVRARGARGATPLIAARSVRGEFRARLGSRA